MKEYVVHEEEYKGLTIKIIPDDDPVMNPVEDYDMLGKQVYWHRRMNLGHCWKETNKYSPEEWLESKLEDGLYITWVEMDEPKPEFIQFLLEKFEENNLVIPVHAYEHSGITISASGKQAGWDSFDSGQLGFVYVSHADIIKEYGSLDLEKAEKVLIAEVKEYDHYLCGEVYGYRIEDENEEELDSCWGFLGDYEYCLEEARGSADYWAEQKRKRIEPL